MNTFYRQSSALLLFLFLFSNIKGQEFHPDNIVCKKSGSETIYESRNGFKLPASGIIRVLIVFAEYDYINGGDPTPASGTESWPAHSLPVWANELTDFNPSAEKALGVITKYYQMASSGNYQVLGDYLLSPDNGGIFSVPAESNNSVGPNNSELIGVVNSKLATNIQTAHGLNSIDYFDLWSCPENEYGLPKQTPSNEFPRKYDHVIFIWRNSTFNGIGNYSYTSPGKMLGYEANSYSWFGTSENIPTQIMIHEYAHLIYGGMDFHNGGGGWFLGGDYWIPGVGGWSNLGLSGASLLCWNAWDRLRLNWIAAGNEFPVSARNETNTAELNGDLDATNSTQSGIYTLRDFVTSGDAIRIKLPFLHPESEYPEYLWIENHNTEYLNGCQWDKFLWQDGNSCIHPAQYSLYSYMQIDREIRAGKTFDEVFKGFANCLRPVTAEGFYDKVFEAATVQNNCISSEPMYPFRRLPGNINPLTGSGDQEFYAVDWNHDDAIDHSDQYYTNIENVDGAYCKNMFNNGHTRNAFTVKGNSKIGLGTNPSSAAMMNMVGYDVPVEGVKNVRKVYLNGISVEITAQNDDGTMQVNIRFDDVDVTNDVRWCADDIVLNRINSASGYSLNLKAGKTIVLDQGTTATRMTNPIEFDNAMIFASPTVFTLEENTKMHLETNAGLLLKNISTLRLKSSSELIVENGSKVEVLAGSTLIIEDQGRLALNGNAKLIVRTGAILCIARGAILTMQQGLPNLVLEPGVIIQNGCIDPSDEYGIRVSPNPASSILVFDYALPADDSPEELIIADAMGKIVDRLWLIGKRGQQILDIHSYPTGFYIYKSVKSGKFKGKFIVK